MRRIILVLFLAATPRLSYGERFYADIRDAGSSIALTFDDGPSPVNTPILLRILKEKSVKATFFLQGSLLVKYPDLVRMIVSDGHAVGLHLWGHENYYSLAKSKDLSWLTKTASESIDKTSSAILKITGKPPKLVRFPYGYSKPWALKLVSDMGFTVINWTFGCDWTKMSLEEFRKQMIKNVKPGAILLMHDGGMKERATLSVLPDIIDNARSKGLAFITLEQYLSDTKVSRSTVKGLPGSR